jgi:hypothetical protein
MTYIPLDIPAGFYRNGTDLEQANRWRDGSLVRWRDGSLRPIYGWTSRKDGFCSNTVRGMHTWEALNGSAYVAGGSYNELIAMVGGGTIYDITPSDLGAGLESASVVTGYGYGDYGDGFYGLERQNYGNYSEATTWSLDNWGEYLVACSAKVAGNGDGRLLEWQLGASADAVEISNAPQDCLGLVVTEERFLFALGAGGNPRKIAFSDQENNTVWTAAATNQAGDIELATAGQIMQGIRTRGQTLILTDIDAHTARYIGPPFVYGFDRVGTACGAVSRKAAVDVDVGVFWMGQNGFFTFNGNTVTDLPCAVHDYVFGDFDRNQQSQVWAWSNTEYDEIWWFYPSANSQIIDRYVSFNYNENFWMIGELSRTSGVSRGVFKHPFLAGEQSDTVTLAVTVQNDSGNKFYINTYTGSAPTISLQIGNTYKFDLSDSSNAGHPLRFSETSDGTHGSGTEYTTGVTTSGTAGSAGAYIQIAVTSSTPSTLYYYCSNHSGMGGVANRVGEVSLFSHETGYDYNDATVFAESGPVSLGNGDQTMHVMQLVPDEKTQGDVSVKFKTRFYPNGAETTHGPYTPANPTSVRFAGRQFRMRVEGAKGADWRVGNMRVDAMPAGRR